MESQISSHYILIHQDIAVDLNITSGKMNEWGCRDGMKNCGNKEIPLAITIKDTFTIMPNPLPV